ncbi:MAG: DNRLRE domain-containing protein, partial [Fibrella sp.]|nr:DNRLRE domain-containing protein [Armatimonadota bacterium]
TENGAEIGTFRRNLASSTPGRGFIKDGTSTHDLARSGVGFWFQGGNVTVENNVATGAGSGFSYFERSGVNLGDSQKVLASTLIDPEAAGGNPFIYSADTPMMRFFGNTAIGCYEGIFTVDNEINGIWPTSSVLENYTDLNSFGYTAVRIEYYRNFTFKNIKILRDSTVPSDSQYGGVYALNANHLVDHLYPWETRATDRHEGVYIRGYWNGVNNDDGDLGVSAGSPERIAKHDVINNSVDFVGPGVAFKNTGNLLGQPLLRYLSGSDILPFPTFTPAAGTYTSGRTVTITASPGTTIYYVTGGTGYEVPSVESKLKPGTWTQYTGPVTISSTKKLIAIAVKNGIYTRIRNGVYTIDPNSPPPPPPTGTGTITHEVWTNVAGTAVANIPVTTAPQTSGTLTSLETGTNIADNYGVRLRGFIHPPTTGNYTFWIAGDDNCELWLSTNDQPGSKVKIASVSSWTNSREWNKLPEQKSAVKSLTAGQKYYVEVLMKEGAGGDNLVVGWLKPGQSGTVPSEVVPGSALSPGAGGTPPPSTTTITLNPTDDRDTQSDNAAGTNTQINTSEWNTSYFRFSTGVLPRQVTSAKLRIYKPDVTSNVLFKASIVTSDAWTQANAPGSLPGLGALITSLTANPAGYIEFDVTNAVRTEAAGDGVFSVAINTGSGNGWIGLTSKEGTNKPQLVVVY